MGAGSAITKEALPESENKYDILGVGPDATIEELRVAYRRLALLHHPDRHPEQEREEAGKIFARIASAYETLSDPVKRQRYDLALARHEEYRESANDAHLVSLAEILAGIDVYEHIFADARLHEISSTLDEIVQKSLIQELGEQIVDAWRIPAVPTGVQHKGSFQAGALVLTNLRVLLPYTYTWQETHGNVRTTYTGAGIPSLPLPLLESIAVVAERRVKRKLWVDFRYEGGRTRIQPRRTNLCKLLLIAQLWGVKVEAVQEDARQAELKWAILRPWIWPVALGVVGVVGAFVLSIFSDNSATDNVADFVDWVRHTGIWQWAMVLSAVTSARRLWRWMFAYSALDLAGTLHATSPIPQDSGEFGQPRVA